MSRFARKRRRAAKAPAAGPFVASVASVTPEAADAKPFVLSACVIVRDGAEDIAWCLESFAGEVDELIVVDTGSQDATVEIARRFTPQVYTFPWRDDFAAAKNFALSKAHGTWAFFPDSDERLSDASRGKLRQAAMAADAEGADALELIRHEIDLTGQPVGLPDNPAVRMIKRTPDLRYRDPIHEYLAYPDGRHVPIANIRAEDILLLHRGYAPERQAAKTARNLAMLEKMEREGTKKLFLHYYLSGAYLNLGRYEDVCREAELSLAAGEHPVPGALDIWRNYQIAAEKLGDDARLRAICERTQREAPELPDTYARLATLAMKAGDYAQAKQLFMDAQQREAAFPMACPKDYDTFRKALPQVEELLAECRKNLKETKTMEKRTRPKPPPLGEVPSECEAERVTQLRGSRSEEQEKRMAKKQAEPKKSAPQVIRTTMPKVAPPSAEEQAATWFAGQLPAAARTVLEFGCGTGADGVAFLRRQPACRYYGVTRRAADVAAAARVLTGACVGTAEAYDFTQTGLSDLDCIAYGPEDSVAITAETLRAHAAHLSERGQMVFMLRNPAYFRDALAALAGHPEPAAGRRTLEELVKLLRAAGMASVYVVPQKDAQEQALAKDEATVVLFQQLTTWGAAHGCPAPENGRDLWTRSFVVRAARQKTAPIYVQSIIGEATVTARVRVEEPDSFLRAELGWILQSSATQMRFAPKKVAGSIAIRQRRGFTSVEEALQTTKTLREHFDLLLYEIDDNPILWHEKNVASAYLDYRAVHAVQVSTPALAEVVRPYNPHVFVLENQLMELPAPRDYVAEAQKRDGRVTIFFGALNREKDWQDILPALNRVAKTHAGKVFFRVLADPLFYQALETQDKEFVADPKQWEGRFVPYPVYQKVLHTADIALLPLHDSAFNRTKSDLKFIESAGHGAVVLASPTVYERTVVDGCTGCIYRNPKEFEAKLTHLIEDDAYRRAIAAAAYQYVKEHRLMSQHYLERAKIYKELLAQKDALDRELTARIADVEK